MCLKGEFEAAINPSGNPEIGLSNDITVSERRYVCDLDLDL